ncbi:hypothetical protein [Luteitalea sp.]
MTLADSIGWTATAVFTASYLTKEHATLRRVQMAGASLWLTYGLVMQAPPVIGSNILVLTAACWAEYRHRRSMRHATPAVSASAVPAVSRAEAA